MAEKFAALKQSLSSSPKFKKTMHEWGKGTLHSGSKKGPKVGSQKQALAIAFSQARKAQS